MSVLSFNPRKTLHKIAVKAKLHKLFNLKLLVASSVLFALLFFAFKSSNKQEARASSTQSKRPDSCTKISPFLANAIIHYASSNSTPQQTFEEISVTADVLSRKSPCNFLVFGLGHDSLMWSALNSGGRTVYLEEDNAWIETMRRKNPELEAYHVIYDTKVKDAEHLLELGRRPECAKIGGDMKLSSCRLALKDLPSVFYELEWDLIMVDAPTGYIPEAPGRMGAIYTAAMVARGRRKGATDVFVHDVDRLVEDKFSNAFLCEAYLKKQEGRLRHFTIPNKHNAGVQMAAFCP